MNIPFGMQIKLSYIASGIIPIFMVFVLWLFNLPILGMFLFSLIVAVLLPIILSTTMTKNPMIQTLTKGLILVFDVNSTGIANMYNARAINETNDKIDLAIDFGNRTEIRSYDRDLVKRFPLPINAVMQFFKRKGEDGKINTTLNLGIEKGRYEESTFGNQYFTVLFYNSETGMCLTKPQIAETEKALMVEMINMDLLRETRLLNRTLRDFMRYTFDQIMNKFTGMLQSDGFKFVSVIVIICVIILIAIMFFPEVSKALLGSTQAVQNAVPVTTGIKPIP